MVMKRLVVTRPAAAVSRRCLADRHCSGAKCRLGDGDGEADIRVLVPIMTREVVREGLIAILPIEIADQPGVLSAISHRIGSN